MNALATATSTLERAETLPGLGSAISTCKSIDLELRAKLADHKQRHRLSLKSIARSIGSSDTMVSRYLDNKFLGVVADFEASIRDYLKTAELRATATGDCPTFETLVTRQVANHIEFHRRNGKVNFIYGEPGIGKTRGIGLYVASNHNTLYVIANSVDCCNAAGLLNALWRQIDSAGYKPSRDGSRGHFLMKKLRGSGRLLLIDNAEVLTPRAIQWIFDFTEPETEGGTGCPCTMIGNKEVMDIIKADAKKFRRVGLSSEVSLKETVNSAAEQLLQRVWPEAFEDLRSLAAQVAHQHGHLGALFHQLRVAKEFCGKSGAETPSKAFRVAHTQLPRNYKLAA